MNCHDVSRIADSGKLADLPASERIKVEMHVRTCGRCAAIWGAHVGLAGLPVPPMPRELLCRLEQVPPLMPAGRGGQARRLTIVGGLAALAAAAGVVMWQQFAPHPAVSAPSAMSPAVRGASTSKPSPESAPGAEDSPPAREAAAGTLRSARESAALPPLKLPLLPRPTSIQPDRSVALDALDKVVRRHPELTQGPDVEEPAFYVVALVMKADGRALRSTVELATPESYTDIMTRAQRTLPGDAGTGITASFAREQRLPGGGALRARTFLRASVVPDDYDIARSDLRVRELLGSKYDHLMLSMSGSEVNLLSVYLSDDGRLLREKVEHLTMQDLMTSTGSDPRVALRSEDNLALKLGITVEQIGITGSTTLEKGDRKAMIGENGIMRVEGERRGVMVHYAWMRRQGEPAATRTPGRSSAQLETAINRAAALTIVERLIPDAFALNPLSAGTPTVILTTGGEVIRAGRVHMRSGASVEDEIREQLVPGIQIKSSAIRSVKLADNTGATTTVMLAWTD